MNTHSRGHWLVLGLVFCLWTGSVALAGREPGPGQLRLTIDSSGRVGVYLVVFTLPPDPAVLAGLAGDALGGKLADVDWDIDDHKRVVSMYAHSGTSLPHRLLSVEGVIQPEPLQRFLTELHCSTFVIHLTHPRSEFSQCEPGQTTLPPNSPITEYRVQVPLGAGPVAPIRLAFGYRASTVVRVLATLGGIALVFLGVALVARMRLRNAPAKARLTVGLLLAFWAAWAGANYWLGADQMAFFLTGAEATWSQTWLLFAMLFAALGIMAALIARTFDRAGAGAPDFRLAPSARALAARLQLTLFLPSLLLASILVARRDLNSAKALAWTGAAAVTTAAALGIFLWENLGALGWLGRREAQEFSSSLDLERKTRVRGWYARLGPVLFWPLIVLLVVRDQRLEGGARYAVLGGALLVSLVLLGVVARVLPKLKRRDEQRLQDQAVTGVAEELPPETSGAANPLGQIGPSIFWLILVGAMAVAVCYLFRFSFDLSESDDGWAMILLSLTAALFERVAHLRAGFRQQA